MKEEGRPYHRPRCIILIILIVLIALLVNFADKNVLTLVFDKRLITGFVAGLVGLLTRNMIFMSGSISETLGKKLEWAYLAYTLFIAASSLLIFGFLNLYPQRIPPHPFYAFLLPLNFYVGMLTYSVIAVFGKVLDLLELLPKK